MLLLRHHFASREIDAQFWQEELRTEDLVVCHTRFHGGRFDEVRNLPAGRRQQWSKARFVLAGRIGAGTANGEVVLEPGDFVVSCGWDDHPCRSLDAKSEYLLVAWRHGTRAGDRPAFGGPVHVRGVDARLGPSVLAFDLADALARDRPSLPAGSALTRALGDFGLPISAEAVRAVSEGIPPRDRRFARAMEATFFPLAARPMAIDLARVLGVTERHALRMAREFLTRYYVTANGWREAVQVMRLELGVFLASNEHATTEAVSRTLGFTSPTSLCHAFHNAGLPSPAEVRRRLVRR